IALLFAGATNLFSYWNSDKLVLSMHNAQEVDELSAPELFAIVRELAQRAGLPMPRVYLMDSPQPNAFATGRNPQNAAVCATTGLLNTLNHQEVAGVIAEMRRPIIARSSGIGRPAPCRAGHRAADQSPAERAKHSPIEHTLGVNRLAPFGPIPFE